MGVVQKQFVSCATLIGVCAWCCLAFSPPESPGLRDAEEAWGKWPASAMQTWGMYVSSKETESEYIPLSCWPEEIRKLNPLYV